MVGLCSLNGHLALHKCFAADQLLIEIELFR
jgi:hypothetical protein